jgi:hypothetical protein
MVGPNQRLARGQANGSVARNKYGKILFHNINSYSSHHQEIEQLMSSNDRPLILALCETQIHPNTTSEPSPIIDHTWHSFPSKSRDASQHSGRGTAGGGIAILHHNSVQCEHLKLYSITEFPPDIKPARDGNGTENVSRTSGVQWFEIRPLRNSKSFILGVAYISPQAQNSNICNPALIDNITSVRQRWPNHPTLLVGDFNLHHIDWDPNIQPGWSGVGAALNAQLLSDGMSDLDLTLINNSNINKQLQVTRPAVRNGATDGTVIDLAFSSHPEIFISATPTQGPPVSDHCPLDIKFLMKIDYNNTSESIKLDHNNWAINRNILEWQSKLPPESDKSVSDPLLTALLLKLTNPRRHSSHSAQRLIQHAYNCWESRINTAILQSVGRTKQLNNRHKWFGKQGVKEANIELNNIKLAWRRFYKSLTRRNIHCPITQHQNIRLDALKAKYKQSLEVYKSLVSQAKSDILNELTESIKLNSKSPLLWNAYKRARPAQPFSSTGTIRNPDSSMPESPSQSLSNLAKKFIEFTQPVRPLDPTRVINSNNYVKSEQYNYGHKPLPSDNWTFPATEIAAFAKKLHQSAPGPDGYSPIIVKHLGVKAYEALSAIYEFSWKYSVLPQQWTESNVISLIKNAKGDRSDPGNYRPISITSIIIRLFEHLIHSKLRALIDPPSLPLDQQILTRHQYGFRAGRSTNNAIHQLVASVTSEQANGRSADEKIPSVAVFVDLAKAFDRVSHTQLMIAVEKHARITGNAWRWIYAFISSNRRIRCVSDGYCSPWHSMLDYGVPQGAVLSPFLFIIFIDVVASVIASNCKYIMMPCFADDVALIQKPLSERDKLIDNSQRVGQQGRHARARKSNTEQVQQLIENDMRSGLQLLSQWCLTVGMKVNDSKSKVLVISTATSPEYYKSNYVPPPNPPWFTTLQLDGFPLQLAKSYEYLGLTLDHKYLWTEHTDKIIEKVRSSSRRISSLFRHRAAAPHPTAAIALVNAILVPQITYASMFFHFNREPLKSLHSALTRPLKAAFDLPPTSNIMGILVDTAIPCIQHTSDKFQIQYAQKYSLPSLSTTVERAAHPGYSLAASEKTIKMPTITLKWQPLIAKTEFRTITEINNELVELHNQNIITPLTAGAVSKAAIRPAPPWGPETKANLRMIAQLRTFLHWKKLQLPVGNKEANTKSPLTIIRQFPAFQIPPFILYTASTLALTTLMRLRHGRAFTNDVRKRFPVTGKTPVSSHCSFPTCLTHSDAAGILSPVEDSARHLLVECPRHALPRATLIQQIKQTPYANSIINNTLTADIAMGELPPGLEAKKSTIQPMKHWFSLIEQFILAVRAATPTTAEYPKPL